MFRIDYHHCDLILYQNESSLRRMKGKNGSTDPESWCTAFVCVRSPSPCDMSRKPPANRRLFITATFHMLGHKSGRYHKINEVDGQQLEKCNCLNQIFPWSRGMKWKSCRLCCRYDLRPWEGTPLDHSQKVFIAELEKRKPNMNRHTSGNLDSCVDRRSRKRASGTASLYRQGVSSAATCRS